MTIINAKLRNRDENSAVTSEERVITVRCRFHPEETYTFKRLFKQQNADILNKCQLPFEQMQELYQSVSDAIEAAAAEDMLYEAETLGTAVMYVPTAALTLNEEWCRNKKVDYSHVAEMIEHPVPKAFGLPTILFRQERNRRGQVVKIVASVGDATHRVIKQAEKGIKYVRAIVTIVEDVAEEALIYSTINYRRRPHAQIDVWKGRVCAKEEVAGTLVKIAKRYGLEIATSDKGKGVYPVIKASAAVEKIYRDYGEDILSRVFELITCTTKQWEIADSLKGDMLQGMAEFIRMFEVPGFAHSTATNKLFSDITPNMILNAELSRNDVEKALGLHLNSDSSQYFRIMHNCAAFANQYLAKTRRGVRAGEPDAKTLEKLFKLRAARSPAATKFAQVKDYHDKLAKKSTSRDAAHVWELVEDNDQYACSKVITR